MKTIVMTATATKLRQIFDFLNDETRPYDGTVGVGRNGKREVEIKCKDEDYEYFKNALL